MGWHIKLAQCLRFYLWMTLMIKRRADGESRHSESGKLDRRVVSANVADTTFDRASTFVPGTQKPLPIPSAAARSLGGSQEAEISLCARMEGWLRTGAEPAPVVHKFPAAVEETAALISGLGRISDCMRNGSLADLSCTLGAIGDPSREACAEPVNCIVTLSHDGQQPAHRLVGNGSIAWTSK